MPTERFKRLVQKKRQAIRDAAVMEFASVPFEKASINKIIRNANISRGSFYTYFEDKLDVLNYVFEDFHEQSFQFIRETLQKNNGDYFDALERVLDFSLDMFENQKLFALVKNVFSSTLGGGIFFDSHASHEDKLCKHTEYVMSLMEFIDMDKLRITKLEEVMQLTILVSVNVAVCFEDYYQGKYDRDALRARYQSGLELLKYGACLTRQI